MRRLSVVLFLLTVLAACTGGVNDATVGEQAPATHLGEIGTFGAQD